MYELDDAALLHRIRSMFERRDPVPPWAVELARLSVWLPAMDECLAEVDLADEPLGLAVRSDSGARTARFQGSDLEIRVEVVGVGAVRGLIGRLLPPGPARIEVRQPRVRRWVDADDLGGFTADDLRPGPLSLVCHRPGRRALATSWMIAD